MNVLTRTAFIGIIAVGMCFVIVSGGIDLSVGSMAALIAGGVILLMNALAGAGPADRVRWRGRAWARAWRWCWARLFGLVHGLADHARAHRAVHRDARHAGHLPRDADLAVGRRRDHARQHAVRRLQRRSITRPCWACPMPVWVFLLVAVGGAADPQPHRRSAATCRPIGSNEQVARYAAVGRRPHQGADLRAAGRLRRHRHAAVRAAPRLGLARPPGCCGSWRRSPP